MGYPDASWTNVTLPDSWSSRGVPAGIGWYRTTFSLHLPSSSYVPIDGQIGGPGPGAGTADYRAFSYVNGWLIGRYVNNAGESGTGTIYYTDGTTQTFPLSIGNFWYPSGQSGNPSNTPVAAVNYANYPTGSSGHPVYLFEQSVTLESGKTVEAVTLPNLGRVAGYNPALRIFAMAVGG